MTLTTVQVRPNGVFPLQNPASSFDGVTASLDPGFYTTFSTLAQGTKVLGLQAHLDRLYLPARELKLKPVVEENALRQRIAELVLKNLPRESRMRLILTREHGEMFILSQPFTPLAKEVYENGVHVVTSTMERSDPRTKGTDFITKSAEQRKLVDGNIFEVLLTHNGKILEGMTSNFYAVEYVVASRQAKQAPVVKLITARSGILLGVTRRAVLRIARGQGLSIEYRPPLINEKFDEAFLTSSSRGVVPIVSIDDVPVGQGRRRAEPVEAVGAWTKTLSQAYQAYVQERSERIVQESG